MGRHGTKSERDPGCRGGLPLAARGRGPRRKPGGRGWLAAALGALALQAFVAVTGASRVWALAQTGAAERRLDGTAQPQPATPRLSWRHSAAFGRHGGAADQAAVAVDADTGRLALGGEAGLAIARPAHNSIARPAHDSSARSFAIAGVRDLRFGPRGELYIASARGFWVLPAASGRLASVPREASPAVGAPARRANRIALGPGFVALATDAGVFIAATAAAPRNHGGPLARLDWARLDAGFPRGPVAVLAAEIAEIAAGAVAQPGVEAAATHLWAVVGSALWRARVSAAGGVERVREVVLPGRPLGEVPVDLRTDLPDGGVALVYPRSILFRVPGASHAWRQIRPSLPPGATISRLGHWPGGLWLATDRGLLVSHSLAGPWRRAGPPAGRAAARAAVTLGKRLYVAGSAGLLYAEPAGGDARRVVVSPMPAPMPLPMPAPSIVAVQRAVLRHQGLEPRVFEDAWRGVRRRAWLPSVGLRLAADRDKARAWERDEVFVSGASHTLRDVDRDRSLDLAASLTMSWDLRDLAYEPEQIDLSREARLVIGLRDDVLDEVNQLYFERLAVESELAALRGGLAREADATGALLAPGREAIGRIGALELRLRELTAGLDAWSGGWFAEQLARSARGGT